MTTRSEKKRGFANEANFRTVIMSQLEAIGLASMQHDFAALEQLYKRLDDMPLPTSEEQAQAMQRVRESWQFAVRNFGLREYEDIQKAVARMQAALALEARFANLFPLELSEPGLAGDDGGKKKS